MNQWKTEDLSVILLKDGQEYPVVTDAALTIEQGKVLGLIGESGCGKSVYWKSILGLMDAKNWKVRGKAFLKGQEIKLQDEQSLQLLRGKNASVILQDPMSSFDPIFTIEQHFVETAAAHMDWSKEDIRKKAAMLMGRLYIKNPEAVLKMYPFQCSGGMLQRIMIAIAMMTEPDILIADEPTTSVDVTVQREIIAMLRELNQSQKTSILFISHDLKAVERLADQIAVMYAGYIVESLPAGDLSSGKVCHPYTKKLLEARPSFTKKRLPVLEGNPPELFQRTGGCPFAPRCAQAVGKCREFDMKETMVEEAHYVRCIKYGCL